MGRYSYGNQPVVAEWNLARFAETLLPLIDDAPERAVALAEESLGRFSGQYSAAWLAGLQTKLGLRGGLDHAAISPVAGDLITLLQQDHVDYTTFFRHLATVARGDAEPARALFGDPTAFDDWTTRWLALGPDPETMDQTNPVYIPRNHLVEEALDAATTDDLAPLEHLLDAVTDPFHERPGLERFAAPAPAGFGRYRTYCGT